MRSLLLLAIAVFPTFAVAQSGEEPRVIVVPYPGDTSQQAVPDAGAPVAQPPPMPTPEVQQAPPPQPPPVPPPASGPVDLQQTAPNDVPPPAPNLEPNPNVISDPEAGKPVGAMLDGHPREGSFLSGPGSMMFVLHHTLMGLLGGISTQLVPRIINTTIYADMNPGLSASDQNARLAYLAAGLIGAGIGFGTSAAWQFFHWTDEPAAAFGITHSLFGAMFGLGLVNLFTGNSVAISWGSLIGAFAGAWLTTIVGGGELPLNKGLLMVSGGGWAAIYVALAVAIAGTSGGVSDARPAIDGVLLAPAIGAGLMALALLKFNPSTAQILRADLFGVAAGGAVLLISALVLGANFNHPVPYILAGVASAGAIATVSLLWAETAEPNTSGVSPAKASLFDPEESKGSKRSWW